MLESGLSSTVVIALLGAALLHASWNAMIRGAGDKGLYTLLLHTCSGMLAIPAVLILGLPAFESWPYLLSSAALHTVYIVYLMNAYHGGQLALSYTLMRGVPPVLVALLAVPMFGEMPKAEGWVGIICLSAGVLGIGLTGNQLPRQLLSNPSSKASLQNAVTIAAYTLVDGIGARLSENPLAYSCCLFALMPWIAITLRYRHNSDELLTYFHRHWPIGLIGALCSTAAYTIVLWAMTQAPIGLVAALRETSVVFAVLIGYLVFHEGKLWPSVLAGFLVLIGIFLVKV